MANIDDMKYDTIYFYGINDKEYGYMSNFYKCLFVGKIRDNENFNFFSVEQYMMYHKALLMNDNDIEKKILNAKNSLECKKLGRKVKPWNEELWKKHRLLIVYQGVFLKFTQNKNLKDKLLNTGNKNIAEASKYDKIWGIGISKNDAIFGKKWKGKNLLGKILVNVRNKIIEKSQIKIQNI